MRIELSAELLNRLVVAEVLLSEAEQDATNLTMRMAPHVSVRHHSPAHRLCASHNVRRPGKAVLRTYR